MLMGAGGGLVTHRPELIGFKRAIWVLDQSLDIRALRGIDAETTNSVKLIPNLRCW